MFSVNPEFTRDERGGEQLPTSPLLDDVIATQTAVEASLEHADDQGDGSIALVLDTVRFNGMSRLQATEAGQWNASFLANKLRHLSPEGMDALARYLAETGSELAERATRLRTERLHAATETWREAGCPGQAPRVREHFAPVSSERKAESALNRLKLMFAKKEDSE